MEQLLHKIRQCDICKHKLPLEPKPIVAAHPKSKIVIIGQAPGSVVHNTGIPWNDKSGDNLRSWMGINNSTFYNSKIIALIPMGFCYPGRGKSGDNPPTKECAPQWHNLLLGALENPRLTLLIGSYAQQYYLKSTGKTTLTETVKNYKTYLPQYFALPHPSPRNNIWQAKNKWFMKSVIPDLKVIISNILADNGS